MLRLLLSSISLFVSITIFSPSLFAQPLRQIRLGKIEVTGTQSEMQLRNVGEEVTELLQAHQTFLTEHGLNTRPQSTLKITLLSSLEEFEAFRSKSSPTNSDRSESPRGYYEHHQQQIVTYETASQGLSSEIRRILTHETFHHSLHETLGDGIPLWLDEGLCVLFEDATVVSGMKLDTQSAHRAALSQVKLSQQKNDLIPLNKLLQMNRDEFYSADKVRNYSQAWSFVHFLVTDSVQKNRRTLDMIFQAIQKGRDPIEVLQTSTGQTLEQLESSWHNHISKL